MLMNSVAPQVHRPTNPPKDAKVSLGCSRKENVRSL